MDRFLRNRFMMSIGTGVFLTILVVLCFGVNYGCRKAGKTDALDQTKEKSVRTSLKIGVVLPYEGRFAGFGEEGKQGIDLAIQHARAKLHGAFSLEVKYADSKGDPADAVRAFRKLSDQDHVDAVIGEVLSANTLAIAPVAQELKTVLVAPASTASEITAAGNYVMRVCFLDPEQGKAMANFARSDLKLEKVALLYEKGNSYSAGLAASFKRSFASLGGNVVGEYFILGEDLDMKAQLMQIRDKDVDGVFLPVEYPTAGQVLKQAREVGLKSQFLGGDAWSSPELFKIGGEAVNGCYITAHFAPDSTDPVVRAFVSDFEAKYGDTPSNMAALSYDAAQIIIHAALHEKENSHSGLRDALLQTKNFHGATGTISLRPNGDAKKDIMILEVQDQKFRYIKTIPMTD